MAVHVNVNITADTEAEYLQVKAQLNVEGQPLAWVFDDAQKTISVTHTTTELEEPA